MASVRPDMRYDENAAGELLGKSAGDIEDCIERPGRAADHDDVPAPLLISGPVCGTRQPGSPGQVLLVVHSANLGASWICLLPQAGAVFGQRAAPRAVLLLPTASRRGTFLSRGPEERHGDTMIPIMEGLDYDEREIDESFIRASGPAGRTSTRWRARCSCASTSAIRAHYRKRCGPASSGSAAIAYRKRG